MLSAAINFAVRRWDWDIPNPVAGMSLKQPEGRLRWLKRTEVDLLIRLAEEEPKTPHLGDFIRLAVCTGCRKSELLELEWDRVDFQAGTLRLERTKNGKRRFIPLTEEAR